MSRTKASGAAHYEILFIVANKFTEDEAKTIMGNIKKIITDNTGQISHDEYWGKKRLAYKIDHNSYGYYGLFEFDLEGENLATIDKALRLSTEVLRHQIVRKKVKSSEDVANEEKIRAKIDSKKAEEEKKEEAAAEESKSTKSKDKKDTRVDLKDLDKKLEGILNADDLI